MSYHSVYVHIPFCQKRCQYCDFLSYSLADQQEAAAQYASAVLQELQQISLPADQKPLQTIYFGGGTPTVLPVQDLIRILQGIVERFGLALAAEVTLETNPATVGQADLAALYQAGFNRLSMGGQSFINRELQQMGRIHRAEDIKRTVLAAKNAGFERVGVDLIYGLPGQSLADWRYNLAQAVALPINHISLYGLQVDNDSPWGKAYATGQLKVAEEELSAQMLELAMTDLAEQGFWHYEIANFAKTAAVDYRSRHNLAYWRRQDYLGLGLGAASCQGNHRWQNVGSLQHYLQALAGGQQPERWEEWLSSRQVVGEAIFLGLRLQEGVAIKRFQQQYGVDLLREFQQEVAELVQYGCLEQAGEFLRLTPKGLLVANQVFEKFV